ncbi:aspartyl/asparaginyl beta-hydroxylase domain-containing protein [Kordiimonas pumila]|uniref:Aspartyl/asparaginyl beta-hydroxylase domain-containing protein n=1 Tax=Kordiimonas pumila TaxID=2161677 RepID=A0ABV7D351_9PROT|nr:aspartyl/asparaginyl beta-hydroxylase domain-containing protein [Kordiimonas pumila]
MNFDGSFLRHGEADMSLLKDLVLQLTPEHWSLEDTRQNRYEVHKSTQAIGLVYDEDFRHINPTVKPAYNLFAPALRQLFAMIADCYEASPAILAKFGRRVEGYFIRVNLVKLAAGGEIAEHKDMNFSLAHSHRIHVPIITNDKVVFKVGQEALSMKEGEIYEINNRRTHAVVNGGTEDRVHLILDWVFPWERCCCSDKVHPGVACSPQACVEIDRLKIPCTCFPEAH